MTSTTKDSRIAALDIAVERGGGIVRFARSMGVTHQAIYHWKRRGWVPADRAAVIESVFGIAREELMEPALAALLRKPSDADGVL